MVNIELYKELFKKESEGFKAFTNKIGENNIQYEMKSNTEKVEQIYILSHGEFGDSGYLKPIALKLLEKIPNSKIILLDLPVDEISINEKKEIILEGTIYNQAKIVHDFINQLRTKDSFYKEVHLLGWKMDNSIKLLFDLMGTNVNEVKLLNILPVWESVEHILDIKSKIKNKIA